MLTAPLHLKKSRYPRPVLRGFKSHYEECRYLVSYYEVLQQNKTTPKPNSITKMYTVCGSSWSGRVSELENYQFTPLSHTYIYNISIMYIYKYK